VRKTADLRTKFGDGKNGSLRVKKAKGTSVPFDNKLQMHQTAVSEANSLNDGLGEKSGNPIDLSSNDSAARVHVANDEEIKPSVRTSGKQKLGFLS
jgi:hypothetical protein